MNTYKGEAVDSVFIGGGTPSVLPNELLKRLLKAVWDNFTIKEDSEFTVEVNPKTIDKEKASLMRKMNVNRISVGVQSFNDNELSAVGRVHNSADAIRTIEILNDVGFSNISLDLMMSLPYQTEDSFKKSLEKAISLPITHISVYSLIIEDDTPIKKKYDSGVFAVPDENIDRRLYAYTKNFLKAHGFTRYEISNYAKPGYESKHNRKYWNLDEYIGIGLAAHSFVGGMRYYNTDKLADYLSGDCRAGCDVLTKQDMMGEYMMLSLRTGEGALKSEFVSKFGCSIESIYKDVLDKFISLSLLERTDTGYALTDAGLDVSNTVMCEFL